MEFEGEEEIKKQEGEAKGSGQAQPLAMTLNDISKQIQNLALAQAN